MFKKLKDREHIVHVVTLATVLGHLFCCGLPMGSALLGVFAGVGVLSPVIPALHEVLHDFEVPLLVFSGAMVGLGWALQHHGSHVDCHDSGCHHAPCGTRKKQASKLLLLATGLFVVNLVLVLDLLELLHHHN
jgi:hypothetical protein